MASRLLALLFAVLQIYFSQTALGQSAEDRNTSATLALHNLLVNQQVVARSVFNKEPALVTFFGAEVANLKARLDPVLDDVSWGREIVNLRYPSLRYGVNQNRRHTAKESTTLLLYDGPATLYIDDASPFNSAVGLLYDTNHLEMHDWRYVYYDDAATSNWLNSDGSPNDVTGPGGDDPENRGSTFKRTTDVLVPGNTRADKVHALWADAKERHNARLALRQNEVLVGLSREAIVGVFFYNSFSPNGAGAAAETNARRFQDSLAAAIAKRQLIRSQLTRTVNGSAVPIEVPLVWIPYFRDNEGQTYYFYSLQYQRDFLSSYVSQLANDGEQLKKRQAAINLKLLLDQELAN